MRCVQELTNKGNMPRLVPVFKKTERTLLSVFMRALDLVAELRAEFLSQCEFRAGRTCKFQSYMEPTYQPAKYSDVRPDGLITCERGQTSWSAFIEAKSEKSAIRPEQILDYANLAASLGVDAVISISNEYPRAAHEPPYYLPGNKTKKRAIYHFAWSEIRAMFETVLASDNVSELEKQVLDDCLFYFWQKLSGILTYDSMPAEWPDFVQSSGVGVGFSAKTPGITEIVKGWHQERRDLCSKLARGLTLFTQQKHELGLKADIHDIVAYDRKALAERYDLRCVYVFKGTKSELHVVAELRDRKITATLAARPPENKAARATISWIARCTEEIATEKTSLLVGWKGRNNQEWAMLSDFRANPEIVLGDNKQAPKFVKLVRQIHDVRRFKSRKGFVEDIEKLVLDLAQDGQSMGWL